MTVQRDVHNNSVTIILRDYQDLAVQHILESIKQGYHRLYVMMPTGTGKGVILAVVSLQRLAVSRVLILIHRQDIAVQLVNILKQMGLNAGLVMQGHHQLDASVVVATTQSLTTDALTALVQASDRPIATILIDEAHHAVAGSAYERIIINLEAGQDQLPVVGFTATPYRSDKSSMLSLLPVCAFARDIPDMIRDGWLAPLIWEPVRVNINLSDLATTRQPGEIDFKEEDLNVQLAREIITTAIVQQVVARIGQRPTLVFAASVEHAQQFAQVFCDIGLHARAVSGAMSRAEREQVYADWRAGMIQIVCNCSLLTEGFDFPGLSALVIARPTLSPSLYLQMLGRGTRPALGKEDCLVLDVMGNRPDTSSQVVLPDIMGDSQAQRGSQSIHRHVTESKQTSDSMLKMLKSVLGTDTPTSVSLLDPIGQSQYYWTAYRHPPYEGYFTEVSKDEAAIVERDPTGSGLYRSRLYPMRSQQAGEARWVESCYLPLRQQVALIHEETGACYNYRLGSRAAPWRDEPATPKQLKKLRVLYPDHADQFTEAWKKGKASEAITYQELRETLLDPPSPEQE